MTAHAASKAAVFGPHSTETTMLLPILIAVAIIALVVHFARRGRTV